MGYVIKTVEFSAGSFLEGQDHVLCKNGIGF